MVGGDEMLLGWLSERHTHLQDRAYKQVIIRTHTVMQYLCFDHHWPRET